MEHENNFALCENGVRIRTLLQADNVKQEGVDASGVKLDKTRRPKASPKKTRKKVCRYPTHVFAVFPPGT